MPTMTISVSPQQANRIQRAVENGDYASDGDVMREALRMWEQHEDARALELHRLKQAYREGMASGKGRDISAEALLVEFKNKASRGG